MTPLTLNILYVVEDGPTVTVIGIDHTTGDQVAVTVDLKPRQRILDALKASGANEPPTFAADGLTMALEFGFADPGLAEAG